MGCLVLGFTFVAIFMTEMRGGSGARRFFVERGLGIFSPIPLSASENSVELLLLAVGCREAQKGVAALRTELRRHLPIRCTVIFNIRFFSAFFLWTPTIRQCSIISAISFKTVLVFLAQFR